MEKNTLAAYLEQIFNLEKSVLVQQNYMEKVNQLYYDVNNTEIYCSLRHPAVAILF